VSALENADCDVRLASELRTWSAEPNAIALDVLYRRSNFEADRLVSGYLSRSPEWVPDIWFTYHNYYRAPDLLGPIVTKRMGVPYVLAEASYSARRAETDWAPWLDAAEAGIRHADAVLSFTERDRKGLCSLTPQNRLHRLSPFLDLADTAAAYAKLTGQPGTKDVQDQQCPRLVTVAMMRPGAKQQSYKLLAHSLAQVLDLEWQLDVIGDGPASQAVKDEFQGGLAERIRWHGELSGSQIYDQLASSDVFVWPGIEEAFGMAYLEAQACGLPIVACRTAGVPAVVRHGEGGMLAESTNANAFSDVLRQVLENKDLRARLARKSRERIVSCHSIEAASTHLRAIVHQLVTAVQI